VRQASNRRKITAGGVDRDALTASAIRETLVFNASSLRNDASMGSNL